MKPSVTLVFTLLFLLVAIFYFKLMPKSSQDSSLEPVQTMRLFTLGENDEITMIQIQNIEQNDSVTLEKVGHDWKIKYPAVDYADKLIMDGLVAALTLSSKSRRLKPEKDWEEYGLLRPRLKVGIETEKQTDRRYLYFGDVSPLGDTVFARWEEENEYFLLDERLFQAFQRSVYSLRLKQIFHTGLKNILKISIRAHDQEYELSNMEGKWFWMEPIPILGEGIEQEMIDVILARIQDLSVKEFLDDNRAPLAKLGIEPLGPSISLWENDQKPSEVLKLGDALPTKDAYYAHRDGDAYAILVSQSVLDNLFQEIEDLAQKFINREVTSKENLYR